MAQSDKHLITLKLILKRFGIDIGRTLVVNEEPPNQDIVSSCIALCQIAHPLGYKFEIMRIAGRHRIRSKQLINDANLLSKKGNRGEFAIMERQYSLNDRLAERIDRVILSLKIPEESKFTQQGWLYLMGLYAVCSASMTEEQLLGIFSNEYRNFIPYLDVVNERIEGIKHG